MRKFLLTMLMMLCFSTSLTSATPLDKAIMSTVIAKTKTAQLTDQIILVVDHNLSLWNKLSDGNWRMAFESYCGYGRNGFSANRQAGDKTTPIGSFPVLYAFGLVENPGTAMTYRKITERSYLSGEVETYNQWIESDRRMYDSEHLADYYQYKYAMNIGFNINPTVYGRGAAIFLHCKSTDRWWTSGCVSVPEEVMLNLLLNCHDGVYIVIAPDFEYVMQN